MKKVLLKLLLVISLLIAIAVNASANENITVYVSENILQCDTVYIDNGRTMVPMRKIFEALNASVDWDSATQTITAVKNEIQIILQINNNIMYKNGIAEQLDVAPVIVNDLTFIPIRAVSQSFNSSVEWLAKTRTVYIDSPNNYKNDYECSIQTEQKIMYAPDGRTICVPNTEIEAYQNVGWFTNPVTIMYAADGRTLVVNSDEVQAYKNVGWYETYEAAAALTNKYQSYGSGNHPNSGGSRIYRTPTGKKYHFDPDCGGKNSYQISLEEAKKAGLQPCAKCAQ